MTGSGPDQRAWTVEEVGAVGEGDPGLALPVQGVDLGGFPVQHGALGRGVGVGLAAQAWQHRAADPTAQTPCRARHCEPEQSVEPGLADQAVLAWPVAFVMEPGEPPLVGIQVPFQRMAEGEQALALFRRRQRPRRLVTQRRRRPTAQVTAQQPYQVGEHEPAFLIQQHGVQDPMVVGETAGVEEGVRHDAPPGRWCWCRAARG